MTAPPLRLQGPPVDPSPARPPGPAKLIGRYGTVERFSAARHGLDLWDAMRGLYQAYRWIKNTERRRTRPAFWK